MIDALDHLTLAGQARAYEVLLGRRVVAGRLQTGNVGLIFGQGGEAVSSMAFATSSLDKAVRLLERRGVATTKGARLELSTAASHGVPIALVERGSVPSPSPVTDDEAASISALDHVVVRTPNPERAIAFMPGGSGSIFGSTAAIPPGARDCCSSVAATSWSRLCTTWTRASRTGRTNCGA
jgi:hypothetical protein